VTIDENPARPAARDGVARDRVARDGADRELVRERLSVAWVFICSGVTLGGWLARIPDVKARVGASDSTWGTIAICGGLGALVSMLLVRRFLDRTGVRPVLLFAVPAQLAMAVVIALAPSTATLAAALVVWGITSGAMTSSMNARAVVVERHYGRVIMPSFHACWSAAALIGALIGAGAAHLGATTAEQMAVTGVLLLVGAVPAYRWLTDGEVIAGPPEPRTFTRQIVLLCAIAFCSQVSEGAASQWSAIYVHDFLRGSVSMGGLAFAAYSLAMAVGRTAGSRVVEAIGRVRTLTICTVIGPAGFAVGLLSHTVAGTIAGLVLLGLGLSCIIPTTFSLASNQPGVTAAAGVTTIGIASWPAGLIGPPLIGHISDATSLQAALLGVAALAAVIAILSRRVRDIRP
jgi:MFS family permease